MRDPAARYEFSGEDDAAIGRLALRMRSVGTWLELYGAFLIIKFGFQLFATRGLLLVLPWDLITGVLLIILGNRTRHSAHGFRNIVLTEGRDIGHLMNAIGDLARIYALIDRVVLVVLILAIVGGIGLFLSSAF